MIDVDLRKSNHLRLIRSHNIKITFEEYSIVDYQHQNPETFFNYLPVEIITNIMEMSGVYNIFNLLNAYTWLEPYLDIVIKKYGSKFLVNSYSLKYIGELNSYILNAVRIDCAAIDIESFLALKNVKKITLFDFFLEPNRKCGDHKTDTTEHEISCDFVCEELIIDNSSYNYYMQSLTLIEFIFKNFSKLKKYTHLEHKYNDGMPNNIFSKLANRACLPDLEIIRLSLFGKSIINIDDVKFESNKQKMRDIIYIFDNCCFDNCDLMKNNCLIELQDQFQLNMPIIEQLEIICMFMDDFKYLKNMAPIICVNLKIDMGLKFNIDKIFAIIDAFLHYSKDSLKSISIRVDYIRSEEEYFSIQRNIESLRLRIKQFSNMEILFLDCSKHSRYKDNIYIFKK